MMMLEDPSLQLTKQATHKLKTRITAGHFDKIVGKPGSVITFGRKLTDVSGALNLDASMTKEGYEKNGGAWVVTNGSSASD